MGALCGSSGFVLTDSVLIDAPRRVVWDTLADIEARPDYLSNVVSVRRTTGNAGDWNEGVAWSETQTFRGKAYVILVSVTSLDRKGEDSWTITIAMNYTDSHGSFKHCVQTSTYTLQALKRGGCRLRLVFVWLPPGLVQQMRFYVEQYCFCALRVIRKLVNEEMFSVKAEAEKRYQRSKYLPIT